MKRSDYQQQFSGPTAGLVPGVLRGYREWTVQISMELTSISAAFAWSSETVTAMCHPIGRGAPGSWQVANTPGPGWHPISFVQAPPRAPRDEPHLAPDPDCTCGIYACHSPFDDQTGRSPSVLHPGGRIFGVIEAWGRVELGSRGFRAQHARIKALAFALPTTWTSHRTDIPWTHHEHTFELPNGVVCKGSELHKYWSDPTDWQMELRRIYRGVTLFRSRAALLAQFPPIEVSSLVQRS